MKNKTILIISPEPWGINFVSKHHYASHLATDGNTVFFLNPPSEQTQIQCVASNLYVLDYKPMLRGANRLPAVFRNGLNSLQINHLQKNYIRQPLDIVWSFDPYRFQNLKQFGAKISIYHPVDTHNTHLETTIAASADYLFGVSDYVLQNFPHHPRKYKISHGLADHFIGEHAPVASIVQDKARIRVGYIGNLNMQFLRTDLILKILEDNPMVDFYFIGPHQSNNLSPIENKTFITRLQALPNAHLLGAKPSRELPNYLASFDAFLLAYHPIIASPHKFLEYLSATRVLVATYADEYKDKTHLLRMAAANEAESLPELFADTIANLAYYNNAQLRAERLQYALDNTYNKQIHRISTIINV